MCYVSLTERIIYESIQITDSPFSNSENDPVIFYSHRIPVIFNLYGCVSGFQGFCCIWILTIGSLLFLYFDYKYFYKTIQESDSLRRSAYLDDLTGMPNRFSCDLVFQMYAGDTSKIEHVACALITISNLIQTNITFGRDAGNQILIDFSNILEEVGEDYGFVGRNGGNEFLLVIENCSQQYMEAFFDKLNIRIKRYNALELNNPIEINYKYILNDTLHATRFSDIITEVYNQLHKTNF